MKAIYRSGEQRVIDHTPAADVAAGDIVLLNETVGNGFGIALRPILAGQLGSIATAGIFDIKKTAVVIEAGREYAGDYVNANGVYDHVNEATPAGVALEFVIGLAVKDAAASDERVLIMLNVSANASAA